MRKLPVFVLAAATALTVAGVPMTAHAATVCVTGTNGTNCYVTSCSGLTTSKNNILNQIRLNKYNGPSCTTGSGCGIGQSCTNNKNCNLGQSCSGNKGCTNGFQGMSIVLRK